MVDQSADPDLSGRIVDAFPDALIEDPILTDETTRVFEGHEHRVTWDAPATDVESIRALPRVPEWVNVKPSRMGTIETVCDVVAYCLARDIRMYGGGQTELGVGRQHIHPLAPQFYPDAPNDAAPRRYTDPEPVGGLPRSPLLPPTAPRGVRWRSSS